MTNTFVQEIENINNACLSDTETARELRKLLTQNLESTDFKLSCIENGIDEMQRNKVAYIPPIYSDKEFDLRLIYWPPNFGNEIHSHDSVSVTGVFFNELTFKGYKLSRENEGIEHRSIRGKMNEVGYVLPGELHSVSNDTASPSISLHFFKKDRANDTDDLTHESKAKRVSYKNFDVIEYQNIANLSFLSSLDMPYADSLIDRLFELASLKYKLVILNHAIALDLAHSKRFCTRLLETAEDAELKKLLSAIAQKL